MYLILMLSGRFKILPTLLYNYVQGDLDLKKIFFKAQIDDNAIKGQQVTILQEVRNLDFVENYGISQPNPKFGDMVKTHSVIYVVKEDY